MNLSTTICWMQHAFVRHYTCKIWQEYCHDDSETDVPDGHDISVLGVPFSIQHKGFNSVCSKSMSCWWVSSHWGGAWTIVCQYCPSNCFTLSLIPTIQSLKCGETAQVAAYIEDMQDVKSPKDVLKSVHAAVDEAVEVLRDDKALLDVRFLGPIMDRSWWLLSHDAMWDWRLCPDTLVRLHRWLQIHQPGAKGRDRGNLFK